MTQSTQTRAEHLAWCKQRALEYVDQGDTMNALGSMTSDLGKHPETAGHAGIELGMMLALGGHLTSSRDMREWIEGFQLMAAFVALAVVFLWLAAAVVGGWIACFVGDATLDLLAARADRRAVVRAARSRQVPTGWDKP